MVYKLVKVFLTVAVNLTAAYSINRRFLLVISGDIEKNPGPKDICPCDIRPKVKTFEIECDKCVQVWHSNCVGLEGITEAAILKLTKWKCPLVHSFN